MKIPTALMKKAGKNSLKSNLFSTMMKGNFASPRQICARKNYLSPIIIIPFMAEKLFITADELLIDSYRLAKKIYDSGFKPTFMAALWRGGTLVGCPVQEFLAHKGIEADHIAVRTSRYTGIEKADETVKIHGFDYIIKRISNTDKLLIVDDVFDTGITIKAVIEKLKKKARANTPAEIKVAAVYYKPMNNKTSIKPDFYIHETGNWLVFPHELEGLSMEDIEARKGRDIAELLR